MSVKKWKVLSDISEGARLLSKEINISPVTAQILINRGFSSKKGIEDFLNPFLSKLPEMNIGDLDLAAKRLADAVISKETICIYGDYDIDGSSAIALLVGFFRELEAKVFYYQPERFGEGYGLFKEAVDKNVELGADVIVTVDCGSSNADVAEHCRSIGIDLIITDHHKLSTVVPNSFAFVNPHKPGENDYFKDLAGVGVAFYLAMAVRKELRDRKFFNKNIKEPDLKAYLDLVALGTIADVVPVLGVNRILLTAGLKKINSEPRQGLKALISLSGLKGELNTENISYILAPRLNASGRMGSAFETVELLLATSESHAEELALKLDARNKERLLVQSIAWQEVEAIVQANPEKYMNSFSMTFSSADWHQGIIGIVASKAVEKWEKPVAVYSIDKNTGLAKGSARSSKGFNLFKVLDSFKDIFENFGGHLPATGMSIKAERLTEFEKLFELGVRESLKEANIEGLLDIELELRQDELNSKSVKELTCLAPFGTGHPYPLFLCRGLGVLNKTILKEKHLKLKLSGGVDAIGFNMAEQEGKVFDKIDLVFKPAMNEWRGKSSIQYQIIDFD